MSRNILLKQSNSLSTTSMNSYNQQYFTVNNDNNSNDYDDEDSIESDFDENLSDHAKILLSYFNHLYQTGKGVDLSLHWSGNVIVKGHRLVIAAFCRKLDPIINNSSNSAHIKIDVCHLGINPDDLRAIIDFFYTGRICIRSSNILRALNELGCYHILPLLNEIYKEEYPMITVEDKYHSINLLNKLKEFKINRQYIDCSFRVQNCEQIECHRYVVAAYSRQLNQTLRPIETPVICMEIDSNKDAVDMMVEFMYSGYIPPGFSEIEGLKELTLTFGIQNLADYLCDDMFIPVNNISTFSHHQKQNINDPIRIKPQAVNIRRSMPPEPDYVEIYNEYVEGPKMAAYKTDDINDLKNEVRNSKNVYRYKCPSCTYMAYDKTTIKKHIRCIHTQETPYICNQCGAAFKIQSNMARHMRTHSKVKPYKCKECGSSYADKKNMDIHVFKTHLKLEPFKCPYKCLNAKFYREDTWVKHYQKNHQSEPLLQFELKPIIE